MNDTNPSTPPASEDETIDRAYLAFDAVTCKVWPDYRSSDIKQGLRAAMAGIIAERDELRARLDAAHAHAKHLAEGRDHAVACAAKLQAFKDYVHARLDAAGVPTDPDSPHKAEGCQIGARLDWMFTTPGAGAVVIQRDQLRNLLSSTLEACEVNAARTFDLEGCETCSADVGELCADDCGRPEVWAVCVLLRRLARMPPLETYEAESAEVGNPSSWEVQQPLLTVEEWKRLTVRGIDLLAKPPADPELAAEIKQQQAATPKPSRLSMACKHCNSLKEREWHLVCKDCWDSLPYPLQYAVIHALAMRTGQPPTKATDDAHNSAMADILDWLRVKRPSGLDMLFEGRPAAAPGTPPAVGCQANGTAVFEPILENGTPNPPAVSCPWCDQVTDHEPNCPGADDPRTAG